MEYDIVTLRLKAGITEIERAKQTSDYSIKKTIRFPDVMILLSPEEKSGTVFCCLTSRQVYNPLELCLSVCVHETT